MQFPVSMCKTCTQPRPGLACARESRNRVGKPGSQGYTARPKPPHCCATIPLREPRSVAWSEPWPLLYLASCPVPRLPPAVSL